MKKTLMMVTACTVGGIGQANAAIDINNLDVKKDALVDVNKDANSGVQKESTSSVKKLLSEVKKESSVSNKSSAITEQPVSVKRAASSTKALTKKFEALQNQLTDVAERKTAKALSTNKVRNNTEINKLIDELESKATTVSLQNDKLSRQYATSTNSVKNEVQASVSNLKTEKKVEKVKKAKPTTTAKAKTEVKLKVKAKDKLKKLTVKAKPKLKFKVKPAIKAKTRKKIESKIKAKSFVALKASYSAKKKTREKAKRRYNRRNPAVIAARRASRRAHSRSRGLCAKYVRRALQSAGYKFKPNRSAYQYATRGTLRKAGFTRISNRSKPQVGDVVVVSRSRRHPHGHISIYNGRHWISDFRQKKSNPYKRRYSYTTWRDTRYANRNGRKGLYMAKR